MRRVRARVKSWLRPRSVSIRKKDGTRSKASATSTSAPPTSARNNRLLFGAVCSRLVNEHRGASMEHSPLSDGKDRFDRRAFWKAAGVVTAVGVVEGSLGSVPAHADLTREQRDKMTADEIIQQMKAGNERFRSGNPQHR